MTTRVVSVTAAAAPGLTVTVDGRAHLVLHLLPRLRGRPQVARVTREPPCRLCQAPLIWTAHGWTCSDCRHVPLHRMRPVHCSSLAIRRLVKANYRDLDFETARIAPSRQGAGVERGRGAWGAGSGFGCLTRTHARP